MGIFSPLLSYVPSTAGKRERKAGKKRKSSITGEAAITYRSAISCVRNPKHKIKSQVCVILRISLKRLALNEHHMHTLHHGSPLPQLFFLLSILFLLSLLKLRWDYVTPGGEHSPKQQQQSSELPRLLRSEPGHPSAQPPSTTAYGFLFFL